MEFIGRFHPVLVHLPIGILLLACLFQWLVLRERYKKLEPAIGIALFWGMAFAVASCITGFFLSQSGDYGSGRVDRHMWLGIAVAVVSIIQYYLYKRSVNAGFAKWLALVLTGLVVITGHLGGSLTHGEDYLSSVFAQEDTMQYKRKAIPDAQAAQVYTDIVQPLLQQKCYGCHGPKKQKGKLRLDNPEFILKGGKEGHTLVASDPNRSELIKRILLPRNEEHHMPPKDRPQLSEAEIDLLHWWVESGAHFNKQVKELVQPEKIKPLLLALQQDSDLERTEVPDIPAKEITPADPVVIQQLKQRGAVVIPAAQNSNYLLVNFVTVDTPTEKDFSLLLTIKNQVVSLKLSNQPVEDSVLRTISQCVNLFRLQLDHTHITDKGLTFLKPLQSLKYLNLVGTKVTADGLLSLKENRNLRSLYLFQTGISNSDWARLRKQFPTVLLDSGGYIVPTLPTDTVEVKEKKKEK